MNAFNVWKIKGKIDISFWTLFCLPSQTNMNFITSKTLKVIKENPQHLYKHLTKINLYYKNWRKKLNGVGERNSN